MNDLIKRVESARGPDRELDFDIKQALEPNTAFIPWKDFPPRDDDYIDPTTKRSELARFKGDAVIVPYYTSSLDAAVSLCDRVLPGHEWSVGPDYENNKAWAKVGKDHWDESFEDITAVAATPALALVLAVLMAVG